MISIILLMTIFCWVFVFLLEGPEQEMSSNEDMESTEVRLD